MTPPLPALPRYRSHKLVEALKIAGVERLSNGSAMIEPAEEGYPRFLVSPGYVDKHDPLPGGYYVRYQDGYESWSPAEAFEEGYSAMPHGIGATGEFPNGHLNSQDEGELNMAITADVPRHVVRVEFGKPVAWLALPHDVAFAIAAALARHATTILRGIAKAEPS